MPVSKAGLSEDSDRLPRLMEDPVDLSVQRGDVRVLARGAGVALPGQVIGRLLIFATQVLLARLLGPETFGLFAIGWTTMKVTDQVAAFGMPASVVRFGSLEHRRNPARFRGVVLQSMMAGMGAGLLLGLALFLAAPWLATSLFHKPDLVLVIRLIAPAIPLSAGVRVGAAATRITQRVEVAILVQELFQPGLFLILSMAGHFLGGGLQGVILGLTASHAVSLAAVIVFLVRLFPDLLSIRSGVESALRDIVGLSLPVSLATIFATVTMWVDRLIVGVFRPSAEVGVYQAVSQASTLFAVILGAVSLVFGPMMAHMTVEKDRARMLELYRVTTKWTLYASLPVLLVVWFAAPDVIRLLYGGEYLGGATALVILTAGQIVNAATGPTGPFLNMTGHELEWMAFSGSALLANCVLGVLLVPRYGMEGAALSTAISIGGMSLLGLAAVRRALGGWAFDRRFLKVVAALLATSLFLGFVALLVPSSHPARLALMIPGAVAVFGSVSLALGLDTEDRAFLGMIRKLVTWRPDIEA